MLFSKEAKNFSSIQVFSFFIDSSFFAAQTLLEQNDSMKFPKEYFFALFGLQVSMKLMEDLKDTLKSTK